MDIKINKYTFVGLEDYDTFLEVHPLKNGYRIGNYIYSKGVARKNEIRWGNTPRFTVSRTEFNELVDMFVTHYSANLIKVSNKANEDGMSKCSYDFMTGQLNWTVDKAYRKESELCIYISAEHRCFRIQSADIKDNIKDNVLYNDKLTVEDTVKPYELLQDKVKNDSGKSLGQIFGTVPIKLKDDVRNVIHNFMIGADSNFIAHGNSIIVPHVYEADIDSAYFYQTRLPLPDFHKDSYIIVNGAIDITKHPEYQEQGYAFSIMLKSHNTADIYGHNTIGWQNNEFFRKFICNSGRDGNNFHITEPKQDEVTILLKPAELSNKFYETAKYIWDKKYDIKLIDKQDRTDEQAEMYDMLKHVLNETIGTLYPRNHQRTSTQAHVALFILNRHAQRMLELCEDITNEGNTVIACRTDAIIWTGNQYSKVDTEIGLGNFMLEVADKSFIMTSNGNYTFFDDNGIDYEHTKHQGKSIEDLQAVYTSPLQFLELKNEIKDRHVRENINNIIIYRWQLKGEDNNE